jgi:DNA-binding MarR family transcriptional regulator
MNHQLIYKAIDEALCQGPFDKSATLRATRAVTKALLSPIQKQVLEHINHVPQKASEIAVKCNLKPNYVTIAIHLIMEKSELVKETVGEVDRISRYQLNPL